MKSVLNIYISIRYLHSLRSNDDFPLILVKEKLSSFTYKHHEARTDNRSRS